MFYLHPLAGTLFVVCLVLNGLVTINGEVPCSGSQLTEKCRVDADCLGEGTVCSENICVCHPNYIEFPSNGNYAGNCQKAPDKAGDQCRKPKSYCKPPLICEGDTQCSCVRGRVQYGVCIVSSKYGDHCEDNDDCTAPFTVCNGDSKTCECVQGTSLDGSTCTATPTCPNGQPSTGAKCKLQVPSTSEAFTNIANSGGELDNCESGEICVTDGVSVNGFCCKAECPLGYEPNPEFSCDPVNLNSCPEETHYCHRLVGPSFATSLCCQKPCSEPTPIFANGQCYGRAFLNGACDVSEQCDGGFTMECFNGQCQCRGGFEATKDGDNAELTCTKECGSDTATETHCLSSYGELGDICTIDSQCKEANSFCFMSNCRCRCGFGQVDGHCVDLKTITTTLAPGATTAGGLANLFGIFKNLG